MFDELNDTYEDKQYYTWDELIAEDQEIIRLFNESLHPNQKKYPGMSRWQVLCETMNPNLSLTTSHSSPNISANMLKTASGETATAG